MTEWIFIVSVVVALIVGLVLRSIFAKGGNDSGILLKENEELKRCMEERNSRIEHQNQEISRLLSERDVERANAQNLRSQLTERVEEAKEQLAAQRCAYEERLQEAKEQLAALKSAHDEQLRVAKEEARVALEAQVCQMKAVHEQQLSELKASTDKLIEQMREMSRAEAEGNLKLIQEQMQTTSERVLKSRQEELESRNEESVLRIVDPLRESIKRMSEALDSSKREHNDRMQNLDTLIRENLRQSHDLGATADRLAQALTTKVKTQGNFGELHLKKFLEDMGLMEGTAYTTQQALKDKYGKKIKSDEDKGLIPDFILHFPNNRDVIVDSKVIITDFERYMSATDPEEKDKHLKAHIKALRAQVDLLASKDYSFYLDSEYTKLNFVIMYVFHEGALNLALTNDTTLWRYAYDKHVLIMGPQTMHMNLRILELMWTQMRQLDKHKFIIEQASMIVERTQLFAKRLISSNLLLQKLQKEFEGLTTSSSDGGHSIITPAKRLVDLGIKQKVADKTKADLTALFVENDKSLIMGDAADDDESEDVEASEVETSESSEQDE